MDLRHINRVQFENFEDWQELQKNFVYKIICQNDFYKQLSDMFTADPSVSLFGTRPHDLDGWEVFYIYVRDGCETDEQLHQRFGKKYPFICQALD